MKPLRLLACKIEPGREFFLARLRKRQELFRSKKMAGAAFQRTLRELSLTRVYISETLSTTVINNFAENNGSFIGTLQEMPSPRTSRT